jgi:hypothetical protein
VIYDLAPIMQLEAFQEDRHCRTNRCAGSNCVSDRNDSNGVERTTDYAKDVEATLTEVLKR